jgi:hypothetical protein
MQTARWGRCERRTAVLSVAEQVVEDVPARLAGVFSVAGLDTG